jgi:hypothetical protein
MRRMRLARITVLVPLACSIASDMWAIACEPRHHRFTAGNYIVDMEIRCADPYLGRRLAFVSDTSSGKEICAAGNGAPGPCPNHFVGSVLTATFTVKRTRGKLPRKTLMREYVTVIAQSPDLPPRPPFDRTQLFTDGMITDLQAFGYDESDIREGERENVRKQSRERLWRLCRQELYLNGGTAPFATISWRYTLDSIEILGVQGSHPPHGFQK